MERIGVQPHSVAVVTGATSGIGRSVAHQLAGAGWTVLVHGRAAERVRATIESAGELPGRLLPVVADLETLAGVGELAGQVRAAAPDGVDVLVNNAGAAFDRHRLTVDGVERTMAVNHLAVAGLTFALEPALTGRGSLPRVIMVTSFLERGARPAAEWTLSSGWTQMGAYRTSKLVDLAFTYALAREWAGRVDVLAVDPGSVRTGFQRRAGGPLRLIGLLGKPFMAGPERPARTILAAATALPGHPTGSYVRAGAGGRGDSSALSRDPDFQREVLAETRRHLGLAPS
ncbi:SDR family NAD(P)-dependent oxidoreductase [Nocardia jiangsuensis]|uniref:SDR family NAD(P)-dependent oxidoreductase n=1 Tax=Nocardia jiangsuensis TaxID=1691563 RepID=A0ABV8DYU1_9NOCA